MKIGDVIASVRRRKRIEQQELAKAINKSVSYLSQIENNKRRPSNKLLQAIAIALDAPLSSLLFMMLEEKHFADESKRELFIKAKPIMDDIINFFSEADESKTDAKKQMKESFQRVKRNNSREKV